VPIRTVSGAIDSSGQSSAIAYYSSNISMTHTMNQQSRSNFVPEGFEKMAANVGHEAGAWLPFLPLSKVPNDVDHCSQILLSLNSSRRIEIGGMHIIRIKSNPQ